MSSTSKPEQSTRVSFHPPIADQQRSRAGVQLGRKMGAQILQPTCIPVKVMGGNAVFREKWGKKLGENDGFGRGSRRFF